VVVDFKDAYTFSSLQCNTWYSATQEKHLDIGSFFRDMFLFLLLILLSCKTKVEDIFNSV
jgi:hypothetical protein